MIGTHNSLTYLPAKYKFYELFSFLWRTQNKNLYEQIQLGVTYFDIRVRFKDGKWVVCHGLVDLDLEYEHLKDIIEAFTPNKVRIILERGGYYSKQLFKSTIHSLSHSYANIAFACIKEDWEIIIDDKSLIKDYCYTPWLSGLSFWRNIKRFNFFSTIKKWAKRNNPRVTDSLLKDPVIHFIDYVG